VISLKQSRLLQNSQKISMPQIMKRKRRRKKQALKRSLLSLLPRRVPDQKRKRNSK